MVAFGDRKDFLQVLRMYESSLNLREQEEPEEVGARQTQGLCVLTKDNEKETKPLFSGRMVF